MLVNPDNFDKVIEILKAESVLSLDCETTGLRPYHGDKLFCIILSNKHTAYYFGFHPEHPACLTKIYLALLQTELFSDEKKTWAIHNAKFDMAILARDGCHLTGTVHCTKAIARVVENDRVSLSLDSCARDLGLEKSKAVEDYIKENRLEEKIRVPGKNKRVTLQFYNKVPFEIIRPYAEKDAEITCALYLDQIKKIKSTELPEKLAPGWVPLTQVMENERALTKVVFEMEKIGAMIDRPFCVDAASFEEERKKSAEEKFLQLTGFPFKKSGKVFSELFSSEKNRWKYGKPTKKKFQVNPKFNADTLATFENPLAKLVLEWSDAKAKVDFYNGFLWHADKTDRIHSSFNQDGTKTGRFSSSDPNLQNLTKSEESELNQRFVVRRAIIPTPGKLFAMFDYQQMEYRLLLDYLGNKAMIEKVLGGLDVHEASAKLAGITRSQAKNVNFATIYGAGLGKLAQMLGTSRDEASNIQQSIFAAIPELQPFIEKVQAAASERRFIRNWFGRRCNFPPDSSTHRAVNHLIQGGCADVVKVAMVRVHEFMRPMQSKMVLQIHDELVYEFVPQEIHLIAEIKAIMESVYKPIHGLPLTCGVAYSYKSLADKVEGFPNGQKTGNCF